MSVATELQRIIDAKAGLKTAIEAKGVTVSSSALIDDYADYVDSIPSGGSGAVKEKTVNFVDFDGTLVASYTGEEVQALTALPDGPDHSTDEAPLTFDGWNWTLAEIKSNNTSYPTAIITVGAMYHTTDGKYHLWFDTTGLNECYVVFNTGANTTGTVDWGDGSDVESFAANSTVEHKYTNGLKNHCIADTAGSIFFSTTGISENRLLSLTNIRWPSQANSEGTPWCMHLEDMSVPSGATFFDTTNCKSLKCLIFTRGITRFSSDIAQSSLRYLSTTPNITSFSGNIRFTALTSLFLPGVTSASKTIDQNFQLRNVCLPNLVLTSNNYDLVTKNYSLLEATFSNQSTILPYRLFKNCYALNKANIPTNVTTIENDAFSYCQGLREVTIPAGVTTINTDAFDGVTLQYITSLATTPPTLSSAFSDYNSSLQKVYVPYSADHSVLAAYQTATNWSNAASKMEELPE